MDNFPNRIIKQIPKKPKTPLDADVLKYLKPLAEELDLDVEELALNLHVQGIYQFDDIIEILGIEDLE